MNKEVSVIKRYFRKIVYIYISAESKAKTRNGEMQIRDQVCDLLGEKIKIV